MYFRIFIALIITLLIYLIVYILSCLTTGSGKQSNRSKIEGFVASPRDPSVINQLPYNNYAIISKPSVSTKPFPQYTFMKNFDKSLNNPVKIGSSGKASASIQELSLDSTPETIGGYNDKLYPNSDEFCKNNPSYVACPYTENLKKRNELSNAGKLN
jgi:hypothetical protein